MTALALVALGFVSIAVAAIALARLARGDAPFRWGPWPGLTGRGAAVLLADALLLAGTQWLLGTAEISVADRAALPWLPLVSAGAAGALALAAGLLRMPGAASAAVGVYLLVRSLPSLLLPALAPPPLLWPPTLLLDFVLWLRRDDLERLLDAWPRSRADRMRRAWRRRPKAGPRTFGPRRAAVAGALFGVALAVLEPPYDLLLGADPSRWQIEAVAAAVLLSALSAALTGVVGRAVAIRAQRSRRSW